MGDEVWRDWLRVNKDVTTQCTNALAGSQNGMDLIRIKLAFYKGVNKKGKFSLKLVYKNEANKENRILGEKDLFSFRQYNKGLNAEYFLMGKANQVDFAASLSDRVADSTKIEKKVDFKKQDDVVSDEIIYIM